jgi:hypothetical protein
MRMTLALMAGIYLVASTAVAQAPSGAASKSELLSMDQQIKIGQLITTRTPPLTSAAFLIAIDRIVPAEVELLPLPAEAERLAPQLRGFGYVVVEEQIALVDQRTRSPSYFRAGVDSWTQPDFVTVLTRHVRSVGPLRALYSRQDNAWIPLEPVSASPGKIRHSLFRAACSRGTATIGFMTPLDGVVESVEQVAGHSE